MASIPKKKAERTSAAQSNDGAGGDFWKQQSDMDRFAQETRTRKMIQEVCLPMLDNQTSLQAKLSQDVEKQLSELSDRLDRVEYALYRSDKPDTRFDKIYRQLEALETAHTKDS